MTIIMTIEEINNKSKEFANRVNAINMKLRGDYNHDEHYFDDSSYYPANYFIDSRSGKKITTEGYIIRGRYGHFFKEFEHEPSDKEINNALVDGFHLNAACYIK